MPDSTRDGLPNQGLFTFLASLFKNQPTTTPDVKLMATILTAVAVSIMGRGRAEVGWSWGPGGSREGTCRDVHGRAI